MLPKLALEFPEACRIIKAWGEQQSTGDLMSLQKLRGRHNRDWRAIEKAQTEAAEQIDRIRGLMQNAARDGGSIDSADIALVVFGSLARREWTSGSDLDWTLLIDGEADHGHAETGHRSATLLEQGKFTPPGRAGMFGNLAFSHSLIHQIGGQDDTNRNTTQRMLLLLESQPVGQADAYVRIVRGIIKRYLDNDFRKFRLKVPRFLLNDVHRFWRTMCVDYASKYRERAAEGWAIRNVKLRMSRKLIFVKGLILCYSCEPQWYAERSGKLGSTPTVEAMTRYLEELAKRTPLDILAEVALGHAKDETAVNLFDDYDLFLAGLDDPSIRDHLKKLRPEEAETDRQYNEFQDRCSRFESALEQLFFDNPRLAHLTRKYGVF
jgi:hypothetical protein